MSEHSDLIRRLVAELPPLTAEEIVDARALLKPGFAAIARKREARMDAPDRQAA